MSPEWDLRVESEEAGLLEAVATSHHSPPNYHQQARSSRLERARGHEFGDQHDAKPGPSVLTSRS